MLEIEQKYARADFAALEQRLAHWGVAAAAVHDEADHYFNAPDRDFGQTGEAFRLRRIGEANCLTYKGPKRDAAVKIRTEIEIPFAAGGASAEQMIQMLTCLGYRPVAVVRKRRRQFSLSRDGFDLAVCLDDVEALGHYAEVEIVAPEDRVAPAHAVLTRVIGDLGLDPRNVEPRSYLTMLLAAHGQA